MRADVLCGQSSPGVDVARGRAFLAQAVSAFEGQLGEFLHNAPAHILVIEDDQAIRTLVAALLCDEGYKVRGVQDGRQGLDQLAWPPDLILLDLGMPVMDGATFRARQLELPHSASAIPVIIVTAQRGASEIDGMGAAAIVMKPFDDDNLLATVASVLNGGSRPPGIP